jgi:hypothetical protein
MLLYAWVLVTGNKKRSVFLVLFLSVWGRGRGKGRGRVTKMSPVLYIIKAYKQRKKRIEYTKRPFYNF